MGHALLLDQAADHGWPQFIPVRDYILCPFLWAGFVRVFWQLKKKLKMKHEKGSSKDTESNSQSW